MFVSSFGSIGGKLRRPDASMSLLTDLQTQALEPEYATTASKRNTPGVLALAVALVVIVLTVAGLQTTRGAGDAAAQRAELLERVAGARERQAALSDQVTELDAEVRSLTDSALGDPAQRQELASLEHAIGGGPVTGPGIVVTVNDAANAQNAQGFVLDSDLSRLVNGLRAAGGEAIAVNGRRLTTHTPIRAAGAAITVDYVSLSPPYRVEVIGDPNTLQARFNQTQAAAWWQFIVDNYGLTMTIEQARDDLSLPADPGMVVRYAEAK